eukprot:gene15462-biopygen18709
MVVVVVAPLGAKKHQLSTVRGRNRSPDSKIPAISHPRAAVLSRRSVPLGPREPLEPGRRRRTPESLRDPRERGFAGTGQGVPTERRSWCSSSSSLGRTESDPPSRRRAIHRPP